MAKRILIQIGLVILIIGIASGCNPKVEEDPMEQLYKCTPGMWGPDTSLGYNYGHDCAPFHGTHFSIYSDGSSQDAKQRLAEIAEKEFADLLIDFNIQDIVEELQFESGYTYYIYAITHLEGIGGMGFRNGFFIAAIDSVSIPGAYTRNPDGYRYVIKHELTHVFQFTLTNCASNAACPDWLGVWFREGQAINMGGAGEGYRISTLSEYESWLTDPDHVNPISIYRWHNFPNEQKSGQFYPMFALAYFYLVDQQHGHGATISDMKNLFQLMKKGYSFEEAFAEALHMSVSYYKDNFDTIIRQYLKVSATENVNRLEAKMAFFETAFPQPAIKD